ncbi:MAG: Na+/H+ antiporter NhaA [Ignavibacteriales bacterium]|nr:Na+/H+ antiporter NhaA [Ignavibacteriales bacterium]
MVRERTVRQINRVVQAVANPIQEFLKLQSASGILLFAFTVAAIAWSNSRWSHNYEEWWHTTVSFGFGTFIFSKSLLHWINDGLMTVFFLVVGLEIKREILIGELSSFRKAMLPVVAAVGGMAVPALIYVGFTRGTPAVSGWGIPMATDIAFSLGVLTLLGKRVPIQLKIFLTAFAIVDDIGAVIVIALFYASSIVWGHLAIAGFVLILLVCANWLGVRHLLLYTVLGVILWLAFLGSGIHATVAGVLFAMTIPARSNLDKLGFLKKSHSILEHLEGDNPRHVSSDSEERDQSSVRDLGQVNEDFKSPLQRFEHALHPWVIFVIMPLFAFANAGVRFEVGLGSLMANSVPLGLFLGLVLGKQIGITLFSWVAVKSRIASLPSSVTWRDIYGVAWLGGIGFTMSLFIAGLAFGDGPLMGESKVGIYAASLVSGVGGLLTLRRRAGLPTKNLP